MIIALGFILLGLWALLTRRVALAVLAALALFWVGVFAVVFR